MAFFAVVLDESLNRPLSCVFCLIVSRDCFAPWLCKRAAPCWIPVLIAWLRTVRPLAPEICLSSDLSEARNFKLYCDMTRCQKTLPLVTGDAPEQRSCWISFHGSLDLLRQCILIDIFPPPQCGLLMRSGCWSARLVDPAPAATQGKGA